MSFTLIGFIIYLLIVLIVGFYSYRRNKSHDDYFIAGRKLNSWVVAFSERASGESAWLLLGLPGAAYAAGFMEVWTATGCVVGIIFYWFVIAKRLREQSEQFDAITLPNFYSQKFGGSSAIRLIATLIIIFFFTFYLAAQFNAAGKVLNVTFGIEPLHGIMLGTVVIIFYTMMGGLFAVAWTDLIQGIIMLGTLVILPLAGLSELLTDSQGIEEAFTKGDANFFSTTAGAKGLAGVAVAVSGLSWMFGYMGQPHLLIRFMSISSSDKIKVSRRVAIAWAIPAFAGAMFMGIVGMQLYDKGLFSDTEFIMPYMANNLLPEWLAGIFISGAVAAMMSTADSQLLIISSSVVEDVIIRTFRVNLTKKLILSISRFVTVVVGLLGFVIAVYTDKLVFEMVSYAWSGLGSSFGPALLLMLWWKGTSKQGVISGMVMGTVSTIVWANMPELDAIISSRFVSFVLAIATIFVVSRITGDENSKVKN